MKNTNKKLISIAAASAMVISLASVATANEEGKLYINNTLVENAKIAENDGTTLIPLRAICETLGFEVNWIEEPRTIELVKLPVYITCSPDRDGYTFARTAPMLLGTAPKLIDDLTYVPTNFVDEILKGTIEENEGNYHISYGEVAQTNTISGKVCDMIYEDEKLVQLVLGEKDDPNTQTILNLSEEMVKMAEELNIVIGTEISAEVQDLATLSIPPQMIPVNLTVLEEVVAETEAIEGTICELVYEDEKLVQIVIGDAEDYLSQTVLNLTEELSKEAVELKAEVGKTIKATAAAIKTMSIPAQQPLISIEEIK